MLRTADEPLVEVSRSDRQSVPFTLLEVELVCRRLRQEIPGLGALLATNATCGGQSNPTAFLRFEEGELVLRAQPVGPLVAGAHDLQREYAFLKALHPMGAPVPEPVFYASAGGVLPRQCYVMRKCEGVVHVRATLPDLLPHDRHTLYRAHAETLALLHEVKPHSAGLAAFHRSQDLMTSQARRWSLSFGSHRRNDLDRLDVWIASNAEPTGAPGVVHGDFKFNNLVASADATRITAILDWELATIGDVHLDLAHVYASMWATRPDEYGGLPDSSKQLAQLGIPEFDTYLTWYWQARGAAPRPLSKTHKAIGLLRYAGIFYGIGLRAAAGNAAAPSAARDAALADTFLDRALELASSVAGGS